MVELPKEKPEEPLQLFADVPNLQVLVMGGDGTAGWILSCLDAMQEARAQLPEPHMWSPPPVAVIPLGTGNPPLAFSPFTNASCILILTP